ncbi:MAG: hypothetical protein ABL962_05505, partial [Fimbriimonadaceae bacterium]
ISNFAAVSEANATELSLSLAEIGEIELATTNYNNAFTASNAAKAASHGATATKRTNRTTSEATARKFAKMFLANTALSQDLLAELGLNVVPQPIGPVSTVTDVSVAGYSNGTNKLSWNRAGNAQGTMFMIEAKIGTSTTWVQVGGTTKKAFTHSGQTPGVQVIYRIIAQRNTVSAEPSNTAIVYETSSPNPVFLQQAA